MNAALVAAMKQLARHIGQAAKTRSGASKKRAMNLARDLKRFVREELAIAEQRGEKTK